jgi:hypothetical protein
MSGTQIFCSFCNNMLNECEGCQRFSPVTPTVTHTKPVGKKVTKIQRAAENNLNFHMFI